MGSSSAMAELKKLLIEHGVVLWRRKWLALAGVWAACVLGWAAVLMLPRSYEAHAQAFVDVNGLLNPLLKGIVLDNASTQSSDYLRQMIVSRPNLEEVVHSTGLDANKTTVQKEALLLSLERSVAVKAQGKNLFSISYTNHDPTTVKNVVEAMLTAVGTRVAAASRSGIEKAHGFLDDQIAGYEKQLREADQRRADFHKQYADYLADPVSGKPKLQTLQQQMLQAREFYDSALATRDSLVEQLKTVPEFRTVDIPTVAGNGRVVAASPEVRVAQARADLAQLQSKFTEQHPDVAAARRQVKDLETQAASGNLSSGKSTVPDATHEEIRLRLVQAETMLLAA